MSHAKPRRPVTPIARRAPLPLPAALALAALACRAQPPSVGPNSTNAARAAASSPALSADSASSDSSRAPQPRETPSFEWPVPDGWKHETIPFPLDFAPEIALRGVEELRFAPGFFDRNARGFWSYDFVWWLEGAPNFDVPLLQTTLERYFRGLALAVGGAKYTLDAASFKAELARASGGLDAPTFAGRMHSFDAFTTGQPIDLWIEVRVRDFAVAQRRALEFSISPKPFGDAIWSDLHDCASKFRAR